METGLDVTEGLTREMDGAEGTERYRDRERLRNSHDRGARGGGEAKVGQSREGRRKGDVRKDERGGGKRDSKIESGKESSSTSERNSENCSQDTDQEIAPWRKEEMKRRDVGKERLGEGSTERTREIVASWR